MATRIGLARSGDPWAQELTLAAVYQRTPLRVRVDTASDEVWIERTGGDR